jgi:hypothetical protein
MADKPKMPDDVKATLREALEKGIEDGSYIVIACVNNKNKMHLVSNNPDPRFIAFMGLEIIGSAATATPDEHDTEH